MLRVDLRLDFFGTQFIYMYIYIETSIISVCGYKLIIYLYTYTCIYTYTHTQVAGVGFTCFYQSKTFSTAKTITKGTTQRLQNIGSRPETLNPKVCTLAVQCLGLVCSGVFPHDTPDHIDIRGDPPCLCRSDITSLNPN